VSHNAFNEVKRCIFLYLNNNAYAIALEHKITFTPKTYPLKGELFSTKPLNLMEFYKIMAMMFSTIIPISTHSRVGKIGIGTQFFII